MTLIERRQPMHPRWFSPIMMARLAALLGVLSLAGCSGEKPLTTPVRGTVTYKGKPLSAGIISFYALKVDPGLPNRTPQGSIDASGHYSLSTIRLDDGAVPGDYAVTVFIPPPPAPIDEYSKATANPNVALIPSVYADHLRTPLKATVHGPQSAAEQIDFDLKD
jgi:hypothetical protein